MSISKYINLATVGTTIVLAIGGWIGTYLYGEAKSLYVAVQANTEQRIQNQQFQKILEQVAADVKNTNDDVKEIKRRQLTVQGKAHMETQGDDLTIKVNTIGNAADYSKLSRARITNMSDPDQSSVVVNVIGTFRNVDADYLIMLSKQAGVRLGVRANVNTINVRIEPVN